MPSTARRSTRTRRSARSRAERLATRLALFEEVAQRRARALLRAAVGQWRTDAQDDYATAALHLDDLREVLVDGRIAAFAEGIRLTREMREHVQLATPFERGVSFIERTQGPEFLERMRAAYGPEAFTLIKGLEAKAEVALRRDVVRLVSEGAPTARAIKELSATLDKLGVTPRNAYAVESAYRTQAQLAFNAGRWEADQDPAVQEILWGYEYVTVGDDRVRPEHAELDGTKLPKDDPFWKTFWPPNGYGCRCQALPVFDDEAPERREAPPDAKTAPGFDFNPGVAQETPALVQETKTEISVNVATPYRPFVGQKMYHVSNAQFDEFADRPTWFTPSAEERDAYLANLPNTRGIEVEITSDKFADVAQTQVIADRFFNGQRVQYSMFDRRINEFPAAQVDAFIEAMKEAGYVGAVHPDFSAIDPSGADVYTTVAFNPSRAVKQRRGAS